VPLGGYTQHQIGLVPEPGMEQKCRDKSLNPTASAATVYDAQQITVGLYMWCNYDRESLTRY